ncbi:MAG: DUF1707 SHOCT-like domain-containing protein [Streptosporangiaceae bacterium]
MSQAQAISGEPAVRASDAERDQAAEILRLAYAEGRLTRAELDERTGAAYAAKTRADLCDLTSDLPAPISAPRAHRRPVIPDLPAAAPAPGARTGMYLDPCLLLCLLIAFPPAGIVYWILAARRQPPPSFPSDASSLPGAGAAS